MKKIRVTLNGVQLQRIAGSLRNNLNNLSLNDVEVKNVTTLALYPILKALERLK